MTALSVPSLNLMPVARVVSGQRRRRVRAWGLALAIYTLAAAGVWAYFAFTATSGADVSEQLQAAGEKLQGIKSELSALKAKVAQAEREGMARREVQRHPDFSVLLQRVAGASSDRVTLEKLELKPMDNPGHKGAKPDLAAPWGYKLRLVGIAATQGDVPGFARDLEALGVFETVSVQSIKAREAPIIQRDDGTKVSQPQLFSFEIDAVMSDAGAAKASGAVSGPGGGK